MSLNWETIREPQPSTALIHAVRESAERMGLGQVTALGHMRTSFYAVFDVTTDKGRYVARAGQIERDWSGNARGPLGTSDARPTGQHREHRLLNRAFEQGAMVLPTLGVDTAEAEIGWMTFQESVDRPLTAQEWSDAVRSFWAVEPDPADTIHMMNASKTFERLRALPPGDAHTSLSDRYLRDLEHLFSVSTSDGLIHGDLGPGNAMVTPAGQPLLFDVETACTGPRVWDYIYLITALSGKPGQATADEVRAVFPEFTEEEITAAWRVAKVGAEARSAEKFFRAHVPAA